MNINIKLLLKSVVVLVSSAGMAFGTTITFDDISASIAGSPPWPALVNGYGGLNWNNFYVLDGADSPLSGYKAGTVSGKNVAFNYNGTHALISASAFNLTSAYFTAAWNDNLSLEVQGFVGATLTYDHTYVLSAVSPTLINFNYAGVDEVNFISSGGTSHGYGIGGVGTQFAMDNLTINGTSAVPDAGSTSLMLGAALAGLGVMRRKLA